MSNEIEKSKKENISAEEMLRIFDIESIPLDVLKSAYVDLSEYIEAKEDIN